VTENRNKKWNKISNQFFHYFPSFLSMANDSSSKVEYSSHHPKVEGSSPNASTVTGISRWGRKNPYCVEIHKLIIYYYIILIMYYLKQTEFYHHCLPLLVASCGIWTRTIKLRMMRRVLYHSCNCY
jgi:hypothetical protein